MNCLHTYGCVRFRIESLSLFPLLAHQTRFPRPDIRALRLSVHRPLSLSLYVSPLRSSSLQVDGKALNRDSHLFYFRKHLTHYKHTFHLRFKTTHAELCFYLVSAHMAKTRKSIPLRSPYSYQQRRSAAARPPPLANLRQYTMSYRTPHTLRSPVVNAILTGMRDERGTIRPPTGSALPSAIVNVLKHAITEFIIDFGQTV